MTRTRRTGPSPAPVTAQDGPAAVMIAERSPRWTAMITTIILAVLPGLEVMQNSPAVLPQRRHFRKIDRAAQAAARAAGGQGGTASVRTDVSSGMEGQADVQQLSAEQRGGVR